MTRFRALIVVGLLSTAASAQSPRPPASDEQARLLRGRVLAARRGDPLPRARVAVAGESADQDAVLTDDDGRFTIRLARPSDLILTITRGGYAAKQVRIARKEVVSDATHYVRLDVGAAVSGRVMQPSGRPAVATVVAVRRAEGRQRATPAQWVSETDDRGEYRIGGLPAGRYEIKAGRSRADGSTFAVKTGDEINDVNLILDAPPEKPPREEEALGVSRYGQAGGTAVLHGRVVGDLGEPLAGARVRLVRHGVNLRTASADANGRYSLRGIPEGRYTLHAANPGYVALEYGQRRSSDTGRILHLREDETLRGVEFVLPRGNVITGNVVDEHGQAVEGAIVRALQLRLVSDRMVAQAVPGVRERRSDDRGQYRLFGLLPGAYLVTASIDAAVSNAGRGKGHGYAPSYYPGTADVGEAWPLHVDVERDVYGATIVLAPSPAVRIAGTVRDSNGRGFKGLMLLNTSRRSRGIATEPRTTPVNGTFLFNNVPPGDYILQATAPSDVEDPSEYAFEYFRVMDTDLSLSLTTSPGATIDGRVVVEGGIPHALPPFSLRPVPADLDRAPIAGVGPLQFIGRDGTFAFAGVHGPIRVLLSGGLPGWYLKAVTINGMDATDVPYDFTFRRGWAHARVLISPNGATIRGRVVDDRSAAVSEYTVVVFAADPLRRFAHSRFTKFARPAQDDSFEVTGLPPGDYRVAAVASLDATANPGEWQDPAALDRLSGGAQRIAVGEGDILHVTLRTATPPATRH